MGDHPESTGVADQVTSGELSAELDVMFMQEIVGMTQDELMTVVSKVIRGADISEVYSPERVVKLPKAMGLAGGLSLDLATCDSKGRPWDFDLPVMRQAAIDHVVRDKPLLLIGSPMCTMS